MKKFGGQWFIDWGENFDVAVGGVGSMKVGDLGRLGEALCKLPGVTSESAVETLLSIAK